MKKKTVLWITAIIAVLLLAGLAVYLFRKDDKAPATVTPPKLEPTKITKPSLPGGVPEPSVFNPDQGTGATFHI